VPIIQIVNTSFRQSLFPLVFFSYNAYTVSIPPVLLLYQQPYITTPIQSYLPTLDK